MKRFLRPSAVSARALLVALIGLLTMFLYGCLGGGGGVGPGPEDNSLLIERVDQIIKALASGDGAALDQFRKSSLGPDMPDSSRFMPFYVHDLGDSVTDPEDGNTYTFFYDPNEIRYLTADLAEVPLWTWFRDGNKLGLTIHLSKQEGYWYLDSLMLASLDLTQAAATAGPVPSAALWPMAQDNRWQFVEIQAPPVASRRERPSSRVNAMILNATRVDFRTLSITEDPLPAPDGRQTFRFRMSTYEAGLATSQLDLPIDPGTIEFGRFSNGVSAVDRGFITVPAGAITGVPLWELLDPNHQGLIRAFEQSGLFLQGADTAFNGGRPWRLTDLLVQEGAVATQPITLTAPGIAPRTGEARILVMETLRVSLPWVQGLARRLDISLTWNGSSEVTWTSLFFLPGMGLVGYADYDLATRRPVRFSWVWGASVGTRQFLPPGDSGSLDPFVTIAIAPLPPLQWTVGTPFSLQTTVSGDEPPFTWSLSGAPAWAAIDAGSGLLTGTPIQAGSYSFELSVRDAGDRVSSMRVLADVASAATPVVSGITPAEGFQGGSPIPIEITGRNFFGTPLVRLATATTVGPVATGLTLADAGRLSCSIPVTGIATGLWSIEVINPDGQTATGTNLFRVRPAPASVPVTIDQAVAQADLAAAGPVHFTVVFARAVTGFTSTDVSIGGTAAPTACTVTSLPPDDGTAYDVAVSGMAGNGTVIASLPSNIVLDIEGNGNLPSTSKDNQMVFDATAPGVTIALAAGQPALMNVDTASFTVTFSEGVTGFGDNLADITVSGPVVPGFSVTEISSTTYRVDLTGMTTDGAYSVQIPAAVASDAAGNANTGSSGVVSVTRDTIAPLATISTDGSQQNPTNTTPVNFGLSFSETIQGNWTANMSNAGTAGPVTWAFTTSDTDLRIFTIEATNMTGQGTILPALDPTGLTDQAGNPLTVDVTAAPVTYDSQPPTVGISSIRVGPTTDLTPIPVNVTFSEAVSGFAAGGVTVKNGIMGGFTVISATDYSFQVTITGSGSPLVEIAANGAADAAGNGNLAAPPFTCVVSGADGSDVTIDGSTYVLVPRSTLPDATTVVPAFYCGKYPATAGPVNAAGAFYVNEGNYNIAATTGTRQAATLAAGYPWVYISQADARTACTAAGGALISENQWLSIAHQTLGLAANWRDGTIGSTEASGGGFYRGLYKPGLPRAQPAIGGDIGFDPPPASVTYRIKKLPNNAEVWDIGGNLLQWVDLTMSATSYTGTAIKGAWFETNSGSLTNVNIKTPYTNANSVGAIYINVTTDTCGFMRGLSWSFSEAGAFGLYLGLPGTNTNNDIGFRCVRP